MELGTTRAQLTVQPSHLSFLEHNLLRSDFELDSSYWRVSFILLSEWKLRTLCTVKPSTRRGQGLTKQQHGSIFPQVIFQTLFERFFDPKLPEKNLGFSFLREDLNFKETETEFDSGESKVASTLETRLFNLKWKIKTWNMAEFTFVVRGSSLLSFILVEANYVSLL